jgi:hypothetical protein
MRILAELFEPIESETPMGGRAVSYQPLGVVWLACAATRRRERADANAGPLMIETLSAVTRADDRLEVGRVLRFRGHDWRIVRSDADQPRAGRMSLNLERTR